MRHLPAGDDPKTFPSLTMERHPLNEHTYWRSVRFAYFALVYLVLLWINAANVDFAAAAGGGYGNLLFLVNAFASYNALYLLPAWCSLGSSAVRGRGGGCACREAPFWPPMSRQS